MTNPLSLIPPKVRLTLYVAYAIGSVVLTYLMAKDVAGTDELNLWLGLGAVFGLTAASNAGGKTTNIDELGNRDEYQGQHERTPEV